MTNDQVLAFEQLAGSLAGAYIEMQALAKKNPNDGINSFKLGLINSLLKRINGFTGDQRRPVDGFEAFESTSIPIVSDVLFVLSQYAEALEHIRSQNIAIKFGSWYWVVDGETSDVRTAPPKKLTS